MPAKSRRSAKRARAAGPDRWIIAARTEGSHSRFPAEERIRPAHLREVVQTFSRDRRQVPVVAGRDVADTGHRFPPHSATTNSNLTVPAGEVMDVRFDGLTLWALVRSFMDPDIGVSRIDHLVERGHNHRSVAIDPPTPETDGKRSLHSIDLLPGTVAEGIPNMPRLDESGFGQDAAPARALAAQLALQDMATGTPIACRSLDSLDIDSKTIRRIGPDAAADNRSMTMDVTEKQLAELVDARVAEALKARAMDDEDEEDEEEEERTAEPAEGESKTETKSSKPTKGKTTTRAGFATGSAPGITEEGLAKAVSRALTEGLQALAPILRGEDPPPTEEEQKRTLAKQIVEAEHAAGALEGDRLTAEAETAKLPLATLKRLAKTARAVTKRAGEQPSRSPAQRRAVITVGEHQVQVNPAMSRRFHSLELGETLPGMELLAEATAIAHRNTGGKLSTAAMRDAAQAVLDQRRRNGGGTR